MRTTQEDTLQLWPVGSSRAPDAAGIRDGKRGLGVKPPSFRKPDGGFLSGASREADSFLYLALCFPGCLVLLAKEL
jgi:hypothetical protein